MNRHSHVIKIHNVVGIPDHTICFVFFIANRDDVLISVFLDSKPQCLGTISDISFAIPFDALNYIFFMRTALIPLQNQLDKGVLCHPGKKHAEYLNLVAAPDASREDTITTVNNLDKAIVASLLMEDVLEPRLTFRSKRTAVDDPASTVEVSGMRDPSTKKAKDIVENDMDDLLAAILQDPDVQKAVNGVVGAHTINRALTPKVIIEKYPNLTEDEVEEIRQQVVTRLVLRGSRLGVDEDGTTTVQNSREAFRIPVRVDHIDMDLIDSINPLIHAARPFVSLLFLLTSLNLSWYYSSWSQDNRLIHSTYYKIILSTQP